MRNWLFTFLIFCTVSIANIGFVRDTSGFLPKETLLLSSEVLERLDKVYNFKTVIFYTPEKPTDNSEEGQQVWLAKQMKKLGPYDLYLVISTLDLQLYSNLNRDRNGLFDRKDLNHLLNFFQEMHVRQKSSRALVQAVHQIEATLKTNVGRLARKNVLHREEILKQITPLGLWLGFSGGLLVCFLMIYFQTNTFRSPWITDLRIKIMALKNPTTDVK